MLTALIDFDTVAHRCAASCEPTKEKPDREPLDEAINRADQLVYRILNTTQAERFRGFLGGSENFRKVLYPEYKANRAKLQRPAWLDDVRLFLVEEWKAEICTGYESDDGIGIALGEDSIVCANDKDFRQLAGHHYNFVKDEFFDVDEDEATLAFWTQVLVGDSSDNVRGAKGIGPVKAGRILSGVPAGEMAGVVSQYFDSREEFDLTCRLLRILRSKEEYETLMQQINEADWEAVLGDHNWNHFDETTIRKGEGQEPTEEGSSGDSREVSGAD